MICQMKTLLLTTSPTENLCSGERVIPGKAYASSNYERMYHYDNVIRTLPTLRRRQVGR